MRRRIIDDEGSMGVGALIVFIAMIMLSSIALATMILITERLAQTPQNTGFQALHSTADKILVNEMYVRDGLDNYGIVFQLSPGSRAHSADELYWVLQCTDETGSFHNYGGDFTGSSFDTTNPHTFANESQQLGILARYYDFDSALSVMPDVSLRAPDFINYPSQIAFANIGGAWPGVPFSIRYASIYTGYIDIPADGDYTFRLNSDDGSYMYLDGEEIIENDGVHGLAEASSGAIALTAGFHSFRVDFFENTGENGLQLRWASAAIPAELIPAANFYRSIGPATEITTYEPGIIYELSLDQKDQGPGTDECGPKDLFDNGLTGSIRFLIGGGGYTYEEFEVHNDQPGTRII